MRAQDEEGQRSILWEKCISISPIKAVMKMINDMLSDRIEQFILEQLRQQEERALILKRKEVAEQLNCAPSQVTYVINTRFGPDHRFAVESRRGSGGFIRIAVRTVAAPREESAPIQKAAPIEEQLTNYFRMLVSSGAITMRECLLIKELSDMFLAHCPNEKKELAAKEIAGRIGRILKEGK